MSRQKLLFKAVCFLLVFAFAGGTLSLADPGYQKREASLFRDMFDQLFYYEGTQYLHLERLYRDLFGQKNRALNVNVFDEVPDSTFFTNRHAREPMALAALKQGSALAAGPSGKLTITKGKFEGVAPGFFVRDSQGTKFLLKFDSMDYPELSTSAEIVSSRFLHALGYNVPQYTVEHFTDEDLAIDPAARVYDETGFRKKLTPERLEEYMLFVPKGADGSYRASASRILAGEVLGPMKLQGRRRNDPDDLVNHEDRREIRALRVFGAWLNNFDLRESNTLDVVEERGGRKEIRHYLIDFNAALGATARGVKPPMVGHEYIIDYGETAKATLALGLWKKPWQKRWDEAGREIKDPSIGYFDNRYFDPGRYKTQLPYFPYKDLTRADGFWAAKILMKFTDEEIREIVTTGEFSNPETAGEIAQILIERRDLIGRYWFKEANPLDEFKLFREGDSYELRFEDLAVRYGFVEGASTYRFDVIGRKGRRGKRIAQEEVGEGVFKINSEWLRQYPSLDLLIRTKRQGEKDWSPLVRVEIRQDAEGARLAGILHQD